MSLSWTIITPAGFKEFLNDFRDYGPNQAMIDATLSNYSPGELYLKERGKAGALLITHFCYAFGWGEPKDLESCLLQVAQSRMKAINYVPPYKSSAPEFGAKLDRLEYTEHGGVEFLDEILSNVPDLKVIPLNKTNAHKSNWKDVILSIFGDFDLFERFGGGFALLDDDQFAAESMIGFIGHDRVEIGTVTSPSYRNRGLSTYVSGLLAKDLLQKGLSPYWSCNADNVASQRVAEKAGFLEKKPYSVFQISNLN